jgi:nitrogen fixation protein NifU and related proteins
LHYSAQLLNHFQNPRNPGEVANPDASSELENPACGDILRLTLRMQNDKIAEIRFLAQGCVAAVGCASALTELVVGKSPAAARQLQREQIVQAVGGLPQESSHASHLAIDVLRMLLRHLPE